MGKLKVVVITQARIGSSRLPGKVLEILGTDTLLGVHLKRLTRSALPDQIVVATTNEEGSDKICRIAIENGVECFKGSLNDLLDRFYQVAVKYEADYIVRVTSDCPLIDPVLIDLVVERTVSGNYDYGSNTLTEDYPDGQDVEVFKMNSLKTAWLSAEKRSEREHVTPYIRNNCDINGGSIFRAIDIKARVNYKALRMTVDEPSDLEVIKWLVGELGTNRSWMEYAEFMKENPDKLFNENIQRNEGYQKSKLND